MPFEVSIISVERKLLVLNAEILVERKLLVSNAEILDDALTLLLANASGATTRKRFSESK